MLFFPVAIFLSGISVSSFNSLLSVPSVYHSTVVHNDILSFIVAFKLSQNSFINMSIVCLQVTTECLSYIPPVELVVVVYIMLHTSCTLLHLHLSFPGLPTVILKHLFGLFNATPQLDFLLHFHKMRILWILRCFTPKHDSIAAGAASIYSDTTCASDQRAAQLTSCCSLNVSTLRRICGMLHLLFYTDVTQVVFIYMIRGHKNNV